VEKIISETMKHMLKCFIVRREMSPVTNVLYTGGHIYPLFIETEDG
jgi:hypothetical protein